MSDNKSASDDLSEEKEEATQPPRLSGNPHFLLNKYIKSLTHLHHFYTISAESWDLITDAWYTSMKNRAKKRIRFPKRPGLMAKPPGKAPTGKLWARARWLMTDKHVGFWVKSCFLPLQLLQMKQTHHACSWSSHCTGPLSFSIILWEKGGMENWILMK